MIVQGIVFILAFILIVLLLAGWWKKSRLKRKYPPRGQLIDLGGYRLHLHCLGSGEPVVVMDAGQGESSLTWAHIQAQVAQHSRACVYDRGGLGWSDPSPRPRTALEMEAELRSLLHTAGIPGPYLLVGASLGGLRTASISGQRGLRSGMCCPAMPRCGS